MALDYNTLTLKQKRVLSAIETFIKTKGIPPTVREIGEMVGEKTPGAVQGILNRLEQKGVIKRELGMARSIQLVTDNSQYINPVYIPEIKKVSPRNINDLFNIYNVKKYHPISPEIVKPEGESFLIDCPDNSLFESGIRYEDVLLVAKEYELKDGDVVLVLYENHVLLRKYYNSKEKDTVTLKADSDLIGKDNFSNDEVKIIGKVISKFTNF